MAFWHRRDKRLKKRAERQRKRASRKEARAAKAASKGNTRRADRLNQRAGELRDKASQNLFWDHVTVEMKHHRASDTELDALREAVDAAKAQARNVEAYLVGMEQMVFDDAIAHWNGTAAGEAFGADPNQRQLYRMMRRARLVSGALLRQNIFITLVDDGKFKGRAMPSVLNRPLSANVRMKVDIGAHGAGGTIDVVDLTDTIVHEIAHTFNAITNHPGDGNVRKALRDPASYAKLFRLLG